MWMWLIRKLMIQVRIELDVAWCLIDRDLCVGIPIGNEQARKENHTIIFKPLIIMPYDHYLTVNGITSEAANGGTKAQQDQMNGVSLDTNKPVNTEETPGASPLSNQNTTATNNSQSAEEKSEYERSISLFSPSTNKKSPAEITDLLYPRAERPIPTPGWGAVTKVDPTSMIEKPFDELFDQSINHRGWKLVKAENSVRISVRQSEAISFNTNIPTAFQSLLHTKQPYGRGTTLLKFIRDLNTAAQEGMHGETWH